MLSQGIYLTYTTRQLGKLEDIPGFIIGGYNLKNITYTDAAGLMEDWERKLKELLDKVVDWDARRNE